MKQSKQEKKGAPFSIRLTPDVEERLTKSAEKVKLSKASLAQAAIEAAVEAIEANGGKLENFNLFQSASSQNRSD